MTTFTNSQPGPIHLLVGVEHGEVVVCAEDCERAELTLTPMVAGDGVAEDLIERATVRSGDLFGVTLPRSADGVTTVVRSGRGTVMTSTVVSGGVNVVNSHVGVSIVNGRIVSGAGAVSVGGGVRVTARVPLGSVVTGRTLSASLDARGRLDMVRFNSTSGDLTVEHADRVEAHTVSGDVTVDQGADITAATMSGDVELDGLMRRAQVTTMSGDVAVYALMDCAVTARTMSGDIRISAPADVSVDANTSTMSGRVRTTKRTRA